MNQATEEDLDLLLNVIVKVFEERGPGIYWRRFKQDMTELPCPVVLVYDLVVVQVRVLRESCMLCSGGLGFPSRRPQTSLNDPASEMSCAVRSPTLSSWPNIAMGSPVGTISVSDLVLDYPLSRPLDVY